MLVVVYNVCLYMAHADVIMLLSPSSATGQHRNTRERNNRVFSTGGVYSETVPRSFGSEQNKLLGFLIVVPMVT